MTSPETIKAKAINAILEAIDCDDEEDARQAIKLIKALLGDK